MSNECFIIGVVCGVVIVALSILRVLEQRANDAIDKAYRDMTFTEDDSE